MNRSLAFFLGIVILGITLVTLLYRAVDKSPPAPDSGSVETLTDAQKFLIETQSSLSKWLLGLAYATLAGLFSFRIKSPDDKRFMEHFPLLACALLIISLYGGFLFQQACLFILTRGPSNLLFADGIMLTLQVQFWFLAAGLVLLTVWLFRNPGTAKMAAVLILALAMVCPLAAASEETPTDPVRACVDAWQKDRDQPLGPELTGEAIRLVEELAREEKLSLKGPDLCPFASSVLDELRFSIVKSGKVDKFTEQMAAIVSSTRQDLNNPNFAPGSLVQSLVRLSQIWRSPSGLLMVFAHTGRFEIILSGEMVGVTNWTRRLEPGTYTLQFTVNGLRHREYDRQIKVGDGDMVRVEVGQAVK